MNSPSRLHHHWDQQRLSHILTLPLTSLLFPTPFTKGGGGGGARTPAISKTVAPTNVKFSRVLETPLKVLKLLKLFT